MTILLHTNLHGIFSQQFLFPSHPAAARRPRQGGGTLDNCHYGHYIVVGEVLGPEALPLLTAMATGHPGLCTVHAQSPARLFDRLALALLQAHLPVAPADLLRFLAEAVDVVAYIERMADGSRKITMISEIEGWADGAPILRPLFRFVPERVSAAQVEGDFWLEDEPSDRLRAKLARWGVTL